MGKFYNFSLYLFNHRVVRFLFSGGVAVVMDLVLLFIFVHVFGIHYLPSSVVAFIAGIGVSFLMQKYFTFNDYTRHNIRWQTVLYFGLHTFNLGLNTLLMYVGVDLLHIPYIISQALIAGLLAVGNFFTSKHLVFTPDAIYNKDN